MAQFWLFTRRRSGALGFCGFLLFALTLGTEASEALGIKWQTDLKAAQRLSASTGRPILIVFSADWCINCKKYESTTLGNRTMVDYVNQNFVPVHLDADKEKKIVEILEVKALPCTLVLSSEADLLGKINGCQQSKDVWEVLERSKELQLKVRNVRYAKHP